MEPETNLERIREEYEARQRNILYEDGQRNGWRISAALWGKHSELRPSSILIAFLFLLLAIGILALLFREDIGSDAIAAVLVSEGLLFLSYKLFSQSLSQRTKARLKGNGKRNE